MDIERDSRAGVERRKTDFSSRWPRQFHCRGLRTMSKKDKCQKKTMSKKYNVEKVQCRKIQNPWKNTIFVETTLLQNVEKYINVPPAAILFKIRSNKSPPAKYSITTYIVSGSWKQARRLNKNSVSGDHGDHGSPTSKHPTQQLKKTLARIPWSEPCYNVVATIPLPDNVGVANRTIQTLKKQLVIVIVFPHVRRT